MMWVFLSRRKQQFVKQENNFLLITRSRLLKNGDEGEGGEGGGGDFAGFRKACVM